MNRPGNELFMRRANNYISESQRKAMGAVRMPMGAIIFAKVGGAVFLERKRILARDSCIDNNMAAFILDESRVDTRFVHYLLSAFKMSSLVATTALPSLNSSQLRTIPLLVPEDIQEQRRIASVLGNADDLIASLERTITKKQAIKQGLMQQLLTGRTRLPGFDGGWRNTTLGAVARVTMGQAPTGSSYNEDGIGMPLIQGNADIKGRHTINRLWTTSPTKKCEAGDVILTVRAPVGYVAVASRDSCLGRGVCALAADLDNRFLFHALVHAEQRWTAYGQGSTFTAVNSTEVRSFRIDWPTSASERAAIAQVLDGAENEIGILQRRLTKAHAVKQGMMQELLTGRTRLPVEDMAA